MARSKNTSNPLKSQGQSKGKTREMADHADPRGARTPSYATVTGKGGSGKGGGPADVDHPTQLGGVKADRPGEAGVRKGKVSGAKRADSPGLVKGPSRKRAGAAGAGGRTRTGRDNGGQRGRARGGSRTQGRSRGRA